MQTGCPSELKVLAYCEGTEAREGELHALLKDTHARGEWFKPSRKLASLIAYAARCKTTAGWEDAEDNPELWSRFFNKYGSPGKRREFVGFDDVTIGWELQLCLDLERSVKYQQPRDWSAFDPIGPAWREWERPCGPVLHISHDPRNASEFDWARGDTRLYENKGTRHTASLLAHARDRSTVAAIWVGACIQDLTNERNGNSYSAAQCVPDIVELESSIRAKLGGDWWHAASTCVLPLHFLIPKRCALSVEEFVLMAARHRLATLSEFYPIALWQQGACSQVDADGHREIAA